MITETHDYISSIKNLEERIIALAKQAHIESLKNKKEKSDKASIQARVTSRHYINLEETFDYLNTQIFDGLLPHVLITMDRRKFVGNYSRKRFHHRKEKIFIDEIAMNPDRFDEKDEKILSTFVHKMCHVWQNHYGHPSQPGYHNKEWAAKMATIGLMPSSTGEEGGKKTGYKTSQYIISGGKFEKVIKKLLERVKIEWGSEMSSRTLIDNRQTRQKYICPACSLKAWSIKNAYVICGTCRKRMIESNCQNTGKNRMKTRDGEGYSSKSQKPGTIKS